MKRRDGTITRFPDWLTDARREIILRDWPLPVSTTDILRALRGKIGPEIPPYHAVSAMAAALGAVRPEGYGTVRSTPRTPERRALLHALWVADTPGDEVLRRMNALPGPPVTSAAALGRWACEQRLFRTKMRRPTRNKAKATPLEPAAVIEAIDRVCMLCRKHFIASTRFLRRCENCRKAS